MRPSLLFVLFFGGCDLLGVGGATPGSPDSDEGGSFEAAITASTGGTLSSASGSVTLEVPAGALDADTTLTLDITPTEDGTLSSVYTFGPEGTTFSTPAVLEVRWDGEAGRNEPVTLAVQEGEQWVPLGLSWPVAGGRIRGDVEHFSSHAVTALEGVDICSSGGFGGGEEGETDENGNPIDSCTVLLSDCRSGDTYQAQCFAGVCECSPGGDTNGSPCSNGNGGIEGAAAAASALCGWDAAYVDIEDE